MTRLDDADGSFSYKDKRIFSPLKRRNRLWGHTTRGYAPVGNTAALWPWPIRAPSAEVIIKTWNWPTPAAPPLPRSKPFFGFDNYTCCLDDQNRWKRRYFYVIHLLWTGEPKTFQARPVLQTVTLIVKFLQSLLVINSSEVFSWILCGRPLYILGRRCLNNAASGGWGEVGRNRAGYRKQQIM